MSTQPAATPNHQPPKFSDTLFQAYAANQGRSVVVFLQPSWEAEQIGATHGSGPGIIDLGGMSFRPLADPEVVQRNNLLRSRLAAAIHANTGKPPVYLDALGAFVFAATLEQATVLGRSEDVVSLDLSGSQSLS